MADIRYHKIQALIVDDFESFRLTLNRMLQEFGIGTIDTAATSAEALRYCMSKAYDIILCDQNLGKGKTGQQILEALRHSQNPNSDSLFVLISAESNKSIIMAAYDYEPDGYLTKPITAQALGQRLDRLFAQRMVLEPIYTALKEASVEEAIELCQHEINHKNRYTNQCQKILGRLLLQTGRYAEAEALYRKILDVRQLDWAMLGMAQAKRYQGDALSAQQWLEDIIQFNPLCLKAYDVLAEIMEERGDNHGRQKAIQQAVELSPLSILRQQALGEVALKNNDVLGAANAYRKAVKLGENSVHDKMDIHIDFAHASIQLSKLDKTLAKPIVREALKAAAELPLHFEKENDIKINSYLLESQLYLAAGEERKSKEVLSAAQKLIDEDPSALQLSTKVEWVSALRDQGQEEASERIIQELLDEYEGQEDKLQQIDRLLEEPCSAKNKALVAKINRDGIAFYEAKDYVRAIDAFSSALQDFPQHIGLRLNLVQALLGQSKLEPKNTQILVNIQQTLDYVGQIIPSKHAQYRRYRQLEEVMRSINAGKPQN